MLITKKFISLILLAVVGLGLFWQTATVVNFYANQKEIIEKYCINKDKPQMHCEGKCHLNKKLTVKKISADNLVETIEEISFWIYGVELIQSVDVNVRLSKRHKSIQSQDFIQEEFLSKIFIPPSIIS